MNPLSHGLRAICRPTTGLAIILLATCLHGAETEAPKEYTVFVGATVIADCKGARQLVLGLDRNSLQVRGAEGDKTVPLSLPDSFHSVRGTRLSTLRASIEALRVTSERTAFNQRIGQLELAADAAERQQENRVQQAQADALIAQMAFGSNAASTQFRDSQVADASHQVAETQAVVDDYLIRHPDKLEHDIQNRASAATGARSEDTRPPVLPFAYEQDPVGDGLTLKCRVTAPRPLERAYLAVTIIFTDPRMPGRKREQTTLCALGRVEDKPRKATISFSHLPLGFVLTGCYFDLYGNGQEVPTNLSEGMQVMTEEQVYQHFLDNYLASNPGKTRPPAVMLLAPAGGLRNQINPADLEQVIYARVDPCGGLALSMDADGTQGLPPQVQSVMRFVRFFPGLENGTPVDGQIRLKLSDILR